MDNTAIVSVQEQKQLQLLNNGLITADRFINKNYLINISEQNIVPLDEYEKTTNSIRLFQIIKLVYDKTENINDKLISVYSALQNVDSSALLVINGNGREVRFAGSFSMPGTGSCIFPFWTPEMEKRMEKTIGQRIKECRIKKGMTQEQLAEAMFTRKSTISDYENDKIDFKISVLKKVSRVLETSVTYLTEENAVNIEDEIMQMAMVLQQIKSRELRKAAIAQVKVLAEII